MTQDEGVQVNGADRIKSKPIDVHYVATRVSYNAINGKTLNLGTYSTLAQAARAYRCAAILLHGEFVSAEVEVAA